MLKNSMALFIFMISVSAWSHPVIYKDGVVVSSSNMSGYSDNQLMYSVTNKWASGVNFWRFTKEDKTTQFAFAKLNHLLYRYNGDDSQANVYLHGGIGGVESQIDKRQKKSAYMMGGEVDWETRTLFTAFKYYHFNSPDVTDISMAQARIGFAPYEAKFDEMQSWFMLQAMTMPKVESEIIVTPMLRFFYKNVLWEAGSSTQGDWMLNIMVHY